MTGRLRARGVFKLFRASEIDKDLIDFSFQAINSKAKMVVAMKKVSAVICIAQLLWEITGSM
jgi:hypothetical protein